MTFSKSADTHVMVFAKMHSSGESGGAAYAWTKLFGIASLGNRVRRSISSTTTCNRSAKRQPLCRDLTDLRRVQADQDLPHGGLGDPEPDELFEVAGPADLLPRHRTVHDDLMPRDVLKDAIIAHLMGIGRTAPVTSWAKIPRSASRGKISPSSRNRTSGSPATLETWRGLYWSIQPEEIVDELLARVVAHLTQGNHTTEMVAPVGVTTGALQRALARDFNRQAQRIARQNLTPCAKETFPVAAVAAAQVRRTVAGGVPKRGRRVSRR